MQVMTDLTKLFGAKQLMINLMGQWGKVARGWKIYHRTFSAADIISTETSEKNVVFMNVHAANVEDAHKIKEMKRHMRVHAKKQPFKWHNCEKRIVTFVQPERNLFT